MRKAKLLTVIVVCLLCCGCFKSIDLWGTIGPGGGVKVEMPDAPAVTSDTEIDIKVKSTDNVQHSGQWATDGVHKDGLENKAGPRR